jgi:hypothetical protein
MTTISKKIFLSFVFLPFYLFHAQRTVYVKDSLSKEKLKDVQVIVNNNVYYTNDDGAVLLSNAESDFLFSNSTYKTKKVKHLQDTIFLKPIYKEIEEVVIGKNVDIIKLIHETLSKNSKSFKNYYLDDSTFLVNIKQKGIIDNKINNILVADLNLWTLNTMYNYDLKVKDYNDFININVNDIKYFKSNQKISGFKDIQMKPSDFVYNLFINVKLSNIKLDIINNQISVKTKIIFEDKDYQKITFSYTIPDYDADGFILYNKSDKVITMLVINANQKNNNSVEKINTQGKKYNTVTNQVTATYEEYKKNGKYYPARVLLKGNGINIIDNSSHPFSFEQSLIFKEQKSSSKKGLKNKIDLTKYLSESIQTKEIKTGKTLLSAEEQKFVDEP